MLGVKASCFRHNFFLFPEAIITEWEQHVFTLGGRGSSNNMLDYSV